MQCISSVYVQNIFCILLLFMLLRFPVQIVGCRVEEYVMYTVKNSCIN